MPTLTYNGQSFAIDGRRVWIMAASIHYARVPPELWADRIAAAAQAGFNTIQTACPWSLHEPRRGRYGFEGQGDIRHFIELVAEAGLSAVIRIGPNIGAGYDGGGLPGWIYQEPGVALREANEAFLERVTKFLRKLLAEFEDLQATKGGPILFIQSEHAWNCANPEQADRYLQEVTRIIRESGFTVPVVNANDLWVASPGTIDTWRGWDDLLAHLRQFRQLQPDAPRVVSCLEASSVRTWGGPTSDVRTPAAALEHLAQVLAAGAQPVVCPFHAGTNFGFTAGREPGSPDGFIATNPALGPVLGEAGARTPKYQALKRLVRFASHFSHLFADLDPDYHPTLLALADEHSDTARTTKKQDPSISIVPLRGNGGRIVFVFSRGGSRSVTLLLDDGRSMPVELGDQPVTWYAFNVDLQGSGKLDYCNLCLNAIVDRSVVVMFGPPRSAALLSVGGAPLEATVPSGAKPLVQEHKGLTFVICNERQIDATYHDEHKVYVGVDGLDNDGQPLPASGFSQYWVIGRDGAVETRSAPKAAGGQSANNKSLTGWQASSCADYCDGTSPRFASLDGPRTLVSCGALTGYGWYRLELKNRSSVKRLVHLPQAADRLHLYEQGNFLQLFGAGPGASPEPFQLPLRRGAQTLIALADNLGRFSEGNDLPDPKGLFGHLYEVKLLRTIKPSNVEADTVDPFELRGFIYERARNQRSDTRQVQWTFTHRRQTTILMEICDAQARGTVVLNDVPIAYFAGSTGSGRMCLRLDAGSHESFKRGKNVVRFAPDLQQPEALKEIAKATRFHECVENLSSSAEWGYAKWEVPPAAAFDVVSKTGAKSFKGKPCWWRCQVDGVRRDPPAWIDTSGLSKGQVYLNGHNLGRYFTSTVERRAVGPQSWLYLPEVWLKSSGSNEIVIFDEHGFDPYRAKIRYGVAGQDAT
jgi:hypothetical protein